MPTFEADLQALLGNLVNGRCYALINNSSTIVYPFITFQKITGVPWLLSAENGDKLRIQIDVFASTYAETNTLVNSVKTAMGSATFANSRIMISDAYEEVTKKYRAIIEYYIWKQ